MLTIPIRPTRKDRQVDMMPTPMWLAGLLALASAVMMGQAADEAPPSFTASKLLASDVRKGPHHTVKEPVTTEGFFH